MHNLMSITLEAVIWPMFLMRAGQSKKEKMENVGKALAFGFWEVGVLNIVLRKIGP